MIPKTLSRWCSYLILTGGLLTLVLSAYITILCYTPAPYVDQWTFLDDVAIHHGHYGLGLLWQQESQHRIPLPKLFYLADLFLFKGRNISLLVLAYLIQAAHLCLFGWLCCRLAGFSGTALRTALGVAAFCLFAPSQVENFIFGWQIALLLPLLAATTSVTALAVYGAPRPEGAKLKPPRERYFVIAALAFLVAAFSAANGLILWLILIFEAVALRLPRKTVLVIAWLGLSLSAIYASGYAAGQPSWAALEPVKILEYVWIYFSSSLPAAGHAIAGLLTPLAILLALTGSVVVLRHQGDRFVVVLCALMLFQLASSVMTAAGRVWLGVEQANAGVVRFGVEQAAAGRYQSSAWLFWCCFLLLVLWLVCSRAEPFWLAGFQGIMVGLLIMNSLAVPEILRKEQVRADGLNLGATALRMGVSDGDVTRFLHAGFPPHWVLSVAQYLRAGGKSVYSTGEAASLGRQLDRFYSVTGGDRCLGYVDAVRVIADSWWPGIAVSGWAFDVQAGRRAAQVLLVGPDGRMVGAAATGFGRADVRAAIAAVTSTDTGFSGYVPADLLTSEAGVFAVLADGVSACPLIKGEYLKFNLPPAGGTVANLAPGVTARMRNEVRRATSAPRAGDGFDPPPGNIDQIGTIPLAGKSVVVLPDRMDAAMSGWAVDQTRYSPAAGVDVTIDGIPYTARYGRERADVAQALGSQEYRRSGFDFLLPVSHLPVGTHTLTVRVISANRNDVYWEMDPIKIVVP